MTEIYIFVSEYQYWGRYQPETLNQICHISDSSHCHTLYDESMGLHWLSTDVVCEHRRESVLTHTAIVPLVFQITWQQRFTKSKLDYCKLCQ